VDICDRVARLSPDSAAIIDVDESGAAQTYSFGDLRALSNRMAHLFGAYAGAGDRIAVLLPQQIETAAAHVAIAKMGAIALPLFVQFGPDALLHRLRDSGAAVVITNQECAARLAPLRGDLPDLKEVIVVGADFAERLGPFSDQFTPVDTGPDDPAILIYTSGTTGPAKGALHAHRVLLGHLPGVEMSHDFFPQPGDVIWTPADWAWIGGLLDVLMPALHHGVPVVAHRFDRFDGRAAIELMRRHGVRNAFLPPTALKMMLRCDDIEPLQLRSVASGGETLGKELTDWGERIFGCTINEFYGQTECTLIVSSCAALASPELGVMGWPVPGHRVAVIGPKGELKGEGEEGEIAVLSPDPVMFLGYWRNDAATDAKFVTGPDGLWLRTGDQGFLQSCGRIRYLAREDDVITSSGYRIGPAEIEDCLLSHPAVALVGVIGVPDATRGEVVAAIVQLSEGHFGSEALANELSDYVRSRLAPYEAPKIVEFVGALPMTTTGKIMRGVLRKMISNERN